jgi:aspartate-semialdehyde dehydrogenase
MAWDRTMPERPVVAVAGATGAVGREMLAVLEQRAFPAERVVALASAQRSAAAAVRRRRELVVEEMTERSFAGVDIALFQRRRLGQQAFPRGGRRRRVRDDRQLLGVSHGR